MATQTPPSSTPSTIPAPSLAEDMAKELDRIAHAPQGRIKLSYQALEAGDGRPVIRLLAQPLPSDFGSADFEGDLDVTDDPTLLALKGLEANCSLAEFRQALGAFAAELPKD